jgi:hypothetical protein
MNKSLRNWIVANCKFAAEKHPFTEDEMSRLGPMERQYEKSLESFQIVKDNTKAEYEEGEEYLVGDLIIKGAIYAPVGLLQYHVWNYDHTPGMDIKDVVAKDIEGEYPPVLEEWLRNWGWKPESVVYEPLFVETSGDQHEVTIRATIEAFRTPERNYDEPEEPREATPEQYSRIDDIYTRQLMGR